MPVCREMVTDIMGLTHFNEWQSYQGENQVPFFTVRRSNGGKKQWINMD